MSNDNARSETRHTPGPWKVHSDGEITDATGALVADVNLFHSNGARANARFIVRACNAHDAMYEALKKYVANDNDLRAGCTIDAQDWAEAHQFGSVALAKAEGAV